MCLKRFQSHCRVLLGEGSLDYCRHAHTSYFNMYVGNFTIVMLKVLDPVRFAQNISCAFRSQTSCTLYGVAHLSVSYFVFLQLQRFMDPFIHMKRSDFGAALVENTMVLRRSVIIMKSCWSKVRTNQNKQHKQINRR
jgi:hypothetical protein